MVIISLNWQLLNSADYENFNAVKRMVVLYDWLKKRAIMGDTVAAAIWVDIKSAIYDEPQLKGKQLEVVELVSQHYMPQEEIALRLRVSQQTVSWRLNCAVGVIMEKLNDGKLHKKRRHQMKVYITSDKPDGETNDLVLTNKINCSMCKKEFKRSELIDTISRYDGSDVYRCKKCHEKWKEYKSNTWQNKSERIDDGEFCPKCHIRLTTTKQCSINCS